MGELESVEDAIYDVAVDHRMWIGDDGQPLDYLPEREALIGDFIKEAADAIRAHLADVAGRPEVRQKTVIAVMENAIGDPAKGEPFHVREISTDHAIADAVAAVGAYLRAIGDDK